MKYLLKINLILMVCIITTLLTGCFEELRPQPELHPIEGASVMFIPKGCKIGDMEAPEDGIYLGKSKLIESMIRQREEEERQQKNRGRTGFIIEN